jgi:hypothetical protein
MGYNKYFQKLFLPEKHLKNAIALILKSRREDYREISSKFALR